MESPFDKVSSATCESCSNVVDVARAAPMSKVKCPDCGEDITVPAKLGMLLLLEVVGQGAAGVVYRALDQTLQRNVAVKLLRKTENVDHNRMVEATVAEARALAAINHPNVVHVHSIGMRTGQPYIVMELLLGSNKLNVMLREGWIADEYRGLEIAIDIAAGLQASNDAGLLHRDVKPGNILFNEEGTAKLLDFSVILDAEQSADNEGKRIAIGTPYYIAPEAALGKDVDFRADIYSLGATLFHLLTGRPPFDAAIPKEVIKARLKTQAPDVRSLRSELRPRTAEVVARMLHRNPDERYASHDELIADLRSAFEGAVNVMQDGALADLHEALEDAGGVGKTVSGNQSVRTAREKTGATARQAKSAANSNSGQERQADKQKKPMGVLVGSVAAVLIIIAIVFAVISSGNKDSKGQQDTSKDDLASKGYVPPETKQPKDYYNPDADTFLNGKDTDATDKSADGGDQDSNKDDAEKDKSDKDKTGSTDKPSDKVDPPVKPKPPVQVKTDPVVVLTAKQLQTQWKKVAALSAAAKPTNWKTGKASQITSDSKAKMTQAGDHAILVSKNNAKYDTYTVVMPMPAGIKAQQITAVRLEVLPDPSLPKNGPGLNTAGNFVLSNFTAGVKSKSAKEVEHQLVLRQPIAMFSQKSFAITSAIDESKESGWAVHPRIGKANEAMFIVHSIQSTPDKAVDKANELVFTLEHQSPKYAGLCLGRFRLSVTTDKSPHLQWVLPANIQTALRKPANKRSQVEKKELLAFYDREVVNGLPYTPPGSSNVAVTLAKPPDKSKRGFYVRLIESDSGGLQKSTKVMEDLLSGKRKGKRESLILVPTLNFSDGGDHGIVKPDSRFPTIDQKPYRDHFAFEAQSIIHVPEAGEWTFYVVADDNAVIQVNDGVVASANRSVVIASMPAGYHKLRVLYVEGSGRGVIELLAAKGKHEKLCNHMKLIGDTKNGGLAAYLPPKQPKLATADGRISEDLIAMPTGLAPTPITPYLPVAVSKNGTLVKLPQGAVAIVPRFAKWHYLSRKQPPFQLWMNANFPANNWSTGQAGFGFGRGGFKTGLKGMRGNHSDMYLRTYFSLKDPKQVGKLQLIGRFDDAVIVYLNGKEVGRSAWIKQAGKTAKLDTSVGLAKFEAIDLSKGDKHLVKGKNVLAIEGHNFSADDADFVVDPMLFGVEAAYLVERKKVNKALGWTPRDVELFEDADRIVMKTVKGRDSRIEINDIPNLKGAKVAFVAVYMQSDSASDVKLQYALKPRTGGNDVRKDMAERNVKGQWRPVSFRVKLTGELKQLIFRPDPDRKGHVAEIKWIRIYGNISLKGKPLAQWNFGVVNRKKK
jgi:hypothetical protein